MKPKILFITLALLALSSCSMQDDVGMYCNLGSSPIALAESDKVSADDILAVASKFRAEGNARTRSNDYTTSTILDEEGNAAIYVVNFTDDNGFVLISGTKRYCPVLAYSDKGHFDIASIANSGIVDWKEETVGAISVANSLPDDSIAKYRQLWKQYSNTTDNDKTLKRIKSVHPKFSDPDMNAAQTILQDSVCSWISKGYEVFSIADEEQIELVKGAIYPLYEEEWGSLSIGVKKQFTHNEYIPNFLETEWHQEGGFNLSYPIVNGEKAPAGCGPVAAGQIMYYYKYPARFDWDNMHTNLGTKTTSNFLLEIAKSADATYSTNGTGTTIDKICNVFKAWGYTNAYNAKHNNSLVSENLRSHHPVYMRGYTKGLKEGHAWVCSGRNSYQGESYTEIYTFTSRKEFTCLDRYDYNYFSSTFFYMNWGIRKSTGGTEGNGYYIDNELKLPNQTNSLQQRVDIYNIYPVK